MRRLNEPTGLASAKKMQGNPSRIRGVPRTAKIQGNPAPQRASAIHEDSGKIRGPREAPQFNLGDAPHI